MAGDDNQTSEIEAVRGRLIERVHQQVREIEEAAEMSDMRATERLLEYIGEQADDPKILEAVADLRRRGDTLVRRDDLRTVSRHVGALSGDQAVRPALEHLDRALGGTL